MCLKDLRRSEGSRESRYSAVVSAKNEEQARAKGKRWPIRRFRLGEEPGEDLSALTTPKKDSP